MTERRSSSIALISVAISESSSARRTRFTRRREWRELEERSARSCRACIGTWPSIYAPAVPAFGGPLLLRRRLWGRVRGPPTGALPAATAGVRRRRAFLLVVVDLLNVGLRVGGELILHRVENGLVLRARGLGQSLSGVALLLAVGLAQSVESVGEVIDRVGVLLRRGRRGRRPALGDLGKLLQPAIGELREKLGPRDVVECEREAHIFPRALHGIERIARKARCCGAGRASGDENEDRRGGESRTKERGEGETARAPSEDDDGLGHQASAELLAELGAHHRPLEKWRALLGHARASRDGMSARSASSARNWMPRTVPSRLPTRF